MKVTFIYVNSFWEAKWLCGCTSFSFLFVQWGSTMVLTEPDAGSDVGAARTKAVEQPDGTWHLEGVKRFITSGEHDLADNIVHLVLARPEGAGPGTKGLSLFVVPKFMVDLETGALGERNGVRATNVEHKMGLKASTTCELTFGDGAPAVGYLVGGVHDGIAQMFEVISYARMSIGTKAIATLSTGYLNALAYAKERVQGRDLTRQSDRSAPQVPITHHPDVRRMLMLQKSYSEGLRMLMLWTASLHDTLVQAAANGVRDEDTERLSELMLPLVKGVGSERTHELLTLSLQTLGGSGFLQDYPIEQYIRDAKIDSIYEGTTGIQSLDLFFRKIVKDQGRALTLLLTQVSDFAKGDAGNGALAAERALLARGLEDVQATLGAMVGYLTSSDRGAAQRLQGGAQHGAADARARRPGAGLAAAAPGRGGAGGAVRRPGRARRGVLPGQGRARPGSSPPNGCRCSPPTARWPRRRRST